MNALRISGLVIVLASVVVARGTQPSASLDGVAILRMLNTAQGALAPEGYAALDSLVQSQMFSQSPASELRAAAVRSANRDVVVYGEYSVTLILTTDRKGYHASVVTGGRCGQAWFTNQTGVIYTARPLGCE